MLQVPNPPQNQKQHIDSSRILYSQKNTNKYSAIFHSVFPANFLFHNNFSFDFTKIKASHSPRCTNVRPFLFTTYEVQNTPVDLRFLAIPHIPRLLIQELRGDVVRNTPIPRLHLLDDRPISRGLANRESTSNDTRPYPRRVTTVNSRSYSHRNRAFCKFDFFRNCSTSKILC